MSYLLDGEPAGPAYSVAQELSKDLGVAQEPLPVPLVRIFKDIKTHPIIMAAVVRTEAREGDFAWIGEIFTDRLIFATRAPTQQIDTLERARELNRIGVTHGAVTEAF